MLRSHAGRLCAVAPILFSLVTVCFAQGSRGSITGRILDQQNAVIPGAVVNVKDVLTGVTTKAVTNQTGYYEANFLDPGTYGVSVEMPGFKSMLRIGNRSRNRGPSVDRSSDGSRPGEPVG
jgi:hypothetical protein